MKGVNLGPLGPASYRGSWVENGLRQIERWINTLTRFRGATNLEGGSDGLVPQPQAGDQNKFLRGDGEWANTGGGGGTAAGDAGSIQISDGAGNFTEDADFGYDTTTDTLFAPHVFVADDPYGSSWNGNSTVPTKNAVYDKIEALAATVSPVPVFWTASPFTIVPSSGRQEYVVAAAAVVVAATSKLVWAMITLSGSGTVKKKLKKNYPWSFEVQLRRGAPGSYSYTSLAAASTIIRSNGIANAFRFPLQAFRPRDVAMPAATYDIVLISNFTGPIAPGAVSVSVMGQVP